MTSRSGIRLVATVALVVAALALALAWLVPPVEQPAPLESEVVR